ncbi:MAG TPA: ATP-binding protein [Candidatus Lumbricidophila sp.]|nr:ATP-binding protein [Candidatus Lumbricidophila sp.]
MVRRIRRWGIASRLFALQLVLIAVLAAAGVIWAWVDGIHTVEREASAKSLDVAKTLASDPFVLDSVSRPDPSALLQPYALRVMATTSLDFVTIMAPDRTRFTHPDPNQIGHPFIGNIAPALAGNAFTETYAGTLGPSVRAVVPVLGANHRVVALVAAGITISNTEVALGSRVATVLLAAALMVALGGVGAWLLSRYLASVTWGRGAEELSRMFTYYEGVMHSLSEGLLLQDRTGQVVLANDRAIELLDLHQRPGQGDRPATLAELNLPPELLNLLGAPAPVLDAIALTRTRALVVNREPVLPRRRPRERSDPDRALTPIGVVTTIRDHTELRELAGELATMTTLSDALRSQTHEFANRLHTIAALIELDRAAEAAALATDEHALSQRLADRLFAAVEEPVLIALLLGKAAQASERGIAFDVHLPTMRVATEIPAREFIAIIGNLIDNAFEAAATTEKPSVDVRLDVDGTHLRIEVSDSGDGPADPSRVFDFGVSTKGAGHGIGLALAKQAVARHGGSISVTGSRFEVVLPVTTPTAPARAGLA